MVLKLAQAGTLSPMKNKGEDFVMEACLWGFYGGLRKKKDEAESGGLERN